MSRKTPLKVIARRIWRQLLSAVPLDEGRQSAMPCLPVITVSALAAVFAVSALAQNRELKLTEDLPPGAMQAKATASCLECHEGRIILQQRLSKAAWTKEVDKMMKWGAVVDAPDRDALIDYLSTNFGPDQPRYEAPRSAPVKSGTARK